MKTHYTPANVAKILKCTPEQAAAGLKRTADSIRKYSEADLKRWGKTRQEANRIASGYDSRSKLS